MTPWTPAYQASLSIISQIFLKFMSIESVMSPNHLILCLPLLLLLSVFSNESTLLIRWPKYWSFSSSISPSNEYSGLISVKIDWFESLLSKGLSRVFTSTTVQNLECVYVNNTCIKTQAVPIPKNATSINTAPEVTIVLISTTTH